MEHESRGTAPRMDERDVGIDARIRLKMANGEPLDDEERTWLADLPGAKELSPAEVQRRHEDGESAVRQ